MNYSNDMNGDQLANNDLIYIPKTADEINWKQTVVNKDTATVQEQKDAFNSLLNSDEYLKIEEKPYFSIYDISFFLESFGSAPGGRRLCNAAGRDSFGRFHFPKAAGRPSPWPSMRTAIAGWRHMAAICCVYVVMS
jgi:hypothetical protein